MDHLKKAVALILAAASAASCGVAAFAADYQKGDYNLDGVVDSYDALLALQASVYPEYVTPEKLQIADMNNDGFITSSDALAVLLLSVGLDADDYDYITEPDPAPVSAQTKTQVSEMAGWSAGEVVRKVGPLFTEDQRRTGILASVSMAQFIVESGYGQSDIAINANNCFGIKSFSDGIYRADSPWDGVSAYEVTTIEYDYYGNPFYESAYFRKYACMEDSIADHSEVLLTNKDGDHYRYADVVGVTDYRRACQIIYNGGYCSDPGYVDLLCDVIEYWDLTQYDLQNSGYYASGSSDVQTDDTALAGDDSEVEVDLNLY